jgi:hypothetical protein
MPDDNPDLAAAVAEPARGNALRAAIDNPWAVLILLFAVTGFLGLPVLWISRGFSRTSKIAWSIVVILYTCALIALCVAIVYWAWRGVVSAM